MPSSILTAERVHTLMLDCLFSTEECTAGPNPAPPENAIRVEGIVNAYAFHPERVDRNRKAIRELLDELPDPFFADLGGGMSFLAACEDRHGNHWGEHPSMGALFVLGMAIGEASYLLPRQLWGMMPGGMPYIVVKARTKQPADEVSA